MIRVAICAHTKNERECISTLLAGLYREYDANGEMSEILYTGEGKPYFDAEKANNNLQIDASFDADVLVVALADGVSALGVDVQSSSRAGMLLGRIGEIFSRHKNASNSGDARDSVSYRFYNAEGGEFTERSKDEFFIKELTPDAASVESLAKWTLLEASMRCSANGGTPRTKTVTFKVEKKLYALSVAVN